MPRTETKTKPETETPNLDEEAAAYKKEVAENQSRLESELGEADTHKAALEKTVVGLDEDKGALQTRIQELEEELGQAESQAKKEPFVCDPTIVNAWLCPEDPNTRFHISHTGVHTINDPSSPLGRREHNREGDKFVAFKSGRSPFIDDPEINEWLATRPDQFHNVDDPDTPIWYNLKLAQIVTATSEPSLPPEVDIDAFMAGDIDPVRNDPAQMVAGMKAEVAARRQG